MRAGLRRIRVVYVRFRRRTSALLGAVHLLLGVVGVVAAVIGLLHDMHAFLVFSPVLLYFGAAAFSILSSKVPSKVNIVLCMVLNLLCFISSFPPVTYVFHGGLRQLIPVAAEALGCAHVSPGRCLITQPGYVIVDTNSTCVWHANYTCSPAPIAPPRTECIIDELKLSCGFDGNQFFKNDSTVIATYVLIVVACAEFLTSLISSIICCRTLCHETPASSIITKAGNYIAVPRRLLSMLSSSGEEGIAAEKMLTPDSLNIDIRDLEVFKDDKDKT